MDPDVLLSRADTVIKETAVDEHVTKNERWNLVQQEVSLITIKLHSLFLEISTFIEDQHTSIYSKLPKAQKECNRIETMLDVNNGSFMSDLMALQKSLNDLNNDKSSSFNKIAMLKQCRSKLSRAHHLLLDYSIVTSSLNKVKAIKESAPVGSAPIGSAPSSAPTPSSAESTGSLSAEEQAKRLQTIRECIDSLASVPSHIISLKQLKCYTELDKRYHEAVNDICDVMKPLYCKAVRDRNVDATQELCKYYIKLDQSRRVIELHSDGTSLVVMERLTTAPIVMDQSWFTEFIDYCVSFYKKEKMWCNITYDMFDKALGSSLNEYDMIGHEHEQERSNDVAGTVTSSIISQTTDTTQQPIISYHMTVSDMMLLKMIETSWSRMSNDISIRIKNTMTNNDTMSLTYVGKKLSYLIITVLDMIGLNNKTNHVISDDMIRHIYDMIECISSPFYMILTDSAFNIKRVASSKIDSLLSLPTLSNALSYDTLYDVITSFVQGVVKSLPLVPQVLECSLECTSGVSVLDSAAVVNMMLTSIAEKNGMFVDKLRQWCNIKKHDVGTSGGTVVGTTVGTSTTTSTDIYSMIQKEGITNVMPKIARALGPISCLCWSIERMIMSYDMICHDVVHKYGSTCSIVMDGTPREWLEHIISYDMTNDKMHDTMPLYDMIWTLSWLKQHSDHVTSMNDYLISVKAGVDSKADIDTNTKHVLMTSARATNQMIEQISSFIRDVMVAPIISIMPTYMSSMTKLPPSDPALLLPSYACAPSSYVSSIAEYVLILPEEFVNMDGDVTRFIHDMIGHDVKIEGVGVKCVVMLVDGVIDEVMVLKQNLQSFSMVALRQLACDMGSTKINDLKDIVKFCENALPHEAES